MELQWKAGWPMPKLSQCCPEFYLMGCTYTRIMQGEKPVMPSFIHYYRLLFLTVEASGVGEGIRQKKRKAVSTKHRKVN